MCPHQPMMLMLMTPEQICQMQKEGMRGGMGRQKEGSKKENSGSTVLHRFKGPFITIASAVSSHSHITRGEIKCEPNSFPGPGREKMTHHGGCSARVKPWLCTHKHTPFHRSEQTSGIEARRPSPCECVSTMKEVDLHHSHSYVNVMKM